MPKASEVASELRKLADGLDRAPDADCRKVYVHFPCDEKTQFLTAVAAMPHPLTKSVETDTYGRVKVEYETDAMWINTTVPRALTCELVEPARPAVYRCDPLLSAIEEAALLAPAQEGGE